MTKLQFILNNPFTNKAKFDSFFFFVRKISSHKYLEIQGLRDMTVLAEVDLDLSWKGRDHAGLHLSIGLFGHFVSCKIYDNRHWDYENNEWYK
jgi:hypothetical protein